MTGTWTLRRRSAAARKPSLREERNGAPQRKGSEDEKGGEHRGLGVLAGEVRRFNVPAPLKVPHMGWNSINFVKPEEDRHPVFRGIPDDSYFYFVHSFHCQPSNPADVAATTAYGGPVCAAITKGELVATQFHPEKSADLGLKIYTNFVRHVANMKSGRVN